MHSHICAYYYFIIIPPVINTSTVRLLRDDMMRYVREAKHEPTFIDLPTE